MPPDSFVTVLLVASILSLAGLVGLALLVLVDRPSFSLPFGHLVLATAACDLIYSGSSSSYASASTSWKPAQAQSIILCCPGDRSRSNKRFKCSVWTVYYCVSDNKFTKSINNQTYQEIRFYLYMVLFPRSLSLGHRFAPLGAC